MGSCASGTWDAGAELTGFAKPEGWQPLRMSWDEAFAVDYDEWSAGMTQDIAFYVQLAREADGPVVELAVGNGRVAIPVAQATGQRVIGLDTSPAMLEQARSRASELGVALELREADMRELHLDEPAALIYCPFRALLHLATWPPGPIAAAPSSAWRRRCGPEGASPGTRSPSTTSSPPGSTAYIRTSRHRKDERR